MFTTLIPLLKTFSWQELRHHPWRNAAAVLAVVLGVALAFAVHLINASALDEFAQAVRSVSGQPDLELRSAQGSFDESVYAAIANHPDVALASPVLEVNTYSLNSVGQRSALRVMGVDALLVAQMSPALMPLPSRLELAASAQTAADGNDRFALFAPNTVFLNPSAQAAFMDATATQATTGATLQLQSGLQLVNAKVAGRVNAPGGPLAVMDIGAAQELFGRSGQLSHIDIKLKPGVSRQAFIQSLETLKTTAGWPTSSNASANASVSATVPEEASERLGNLSRAYRVNLSVLAMVALFTGSFLVFSVLSLSVAKRSQQFALLGVLGLTRPQRQNLVLLESAVLGLLGSVGGIALGTALAATALALLGGDLGGGYFAGAAPALQWSGPAALGYGALGFLAALIGGWWPARQAAKLAPAQALKGLGSFEAASNRHWISIILIAVCACLSWLPALFNLPLAAYLAIALLLIGGITALPWLITLLLDRISPLTRYRPLALLAVERARRVKTSASVAVSGVVASLSLAVALTVMVASFRESVTAWLNVVLPADMYLRSARSGSSNEAAFFTPAFVKTIEKLDGVAKLNPQTTRLLQLDASRPAVALVARPLADPNTSLPMVGVALPVPAGQVGIYLSEATSDVYAERQQALFQLLNSALSHDRKAQAATFFIAGVWRDYARQGGSIAMDKADFVRLTGDERVTDVSIWLKPGTDATRVQNAIREAAKTLSPDADKLLEFASSAEIRALTLTIFDRSFAVTYWLQAVAIAIGLFGVAASFSAQVLARRKEFGLLVHLGLTRRQILAVVAGEGLAWTAVGSIAGLVLGLLVSLILVKVVNPQSFHWTMDLAVPWLRLLLLCCAVVVAGTVTAWLAGRAAAGRDAVLAVKEDW